MKRKIFIGFLFLAILAPLSFDFNSVKTVSADATTINWATINSDTIWTKEGSPYIINGDLKIAQGAKLTIMPGVIVKMHLMGIYVEGSLYIPGSPDEKTVITSLNDQDYYGHESGDSNLIEYGWSSIKITETGQAEINYALIKYGGKDFRVDYLDDNIRKSFLKFNTAFAQAYGSEGAINNYGGELKISSSTITDNVIGVITNDYTYYHYDSNAGKYLIELTAHKTNIRNTEISHNELYGIYNYSQMTPVEAKYNFWGDDSGPYSESLNPDGKGDKFVGKINFDPWIGKVVEVKRKPVILVPGIAGSWKKHLVWQMDPILHTYDSLIEALIQSGYELNKDLFLFPYDWHASNITTADLLKAKIQEIKTGTGATKVDIIGHSMGGLVARYYVESSIYNNDVDKLIFLDTPHNGAPESYLAYEGGAIVGKFSRLKKTIFQLEAAESGYLSLSKYIREKVLSTGELLPINNYLLNKNGNAWVERIYPVSYPINQFLEFLNSQSAINILKNNVNITNIYSYQGSIMSSSTISKIKVVADPDIYDNNWADGYPENLNQNENSLIKDDGDGIVPIWSSNYLTGVDEVVMMDADHGQIVTKAQKDVVRILTGSEPTDYYSNPWSSIKRLLFIRVYSPVDFQVITPDGKKIGKDFINNNEINNIDGAYYSGFDSDTEFATILDPIDGDYQIKIIGTATGTYQLGIDMINEETPANQAENLITGITIPGKEETLNFKAIENQDNVLIEKNVSFTSTIQDVKDLKTSKEIKKALIEDLLLLQFNDLNKKYDIMIKENNILRHKLLQVYIDFQLKLIKGEIDLYLKSNWLTAKASDIIKYDVNSLIKLNK
jgi:triacylglycerol esterase/lipase EstA (alpha/beta hydrolase family)